MLEGGFIDGDENDVFRCFFRNKTPPHHDIIDLFIRPDDKREEGEKKSSKDPESDDADVIREGKFHETNRLQTEVKEWMYFCFTKNFFGYRDNDPCLLFAFAVFRCCDGVAGRLFLDGFLFLFPFLRFRNIFYCGEYGCIFFRTDDHKRKK